MGSLLLVAGVAIAALAAAGWVVAVADSAPNLSELKPRDPGQLSQVFASDGTSLGYIHSDVLRTAVNANQVPDGLKKATVAIEDRRFYQHGALDYQGILRAAIKDLFSGGGIQGASTLTMQLVDNIYLPLRYKANHNLKYKIIQAKLAQQLEKVHNKTWILDSYLNDVPYGTVGGQTAYGVGAASEMFFNKPVSKLNLAQSALLAGLPQAPSEYNPFLAPNRARKRRHDVLHSMVQAHDITQAQADVADVKPLGVHRNYSYSQRTQQYFFDYVVQQLHQTFCPGQASTDACPKVDRGGLKIYTTIDLKKELAARQAILSNEGQPGDPAAALVNIDQSNGHIIAMATSSNYDQTSFDYATQSHRQTGSAFKVFSLMTLIHDYQGDPNQTYYKSQELLPGWLPGYPTYHVQTSEHSYAGTISIAHATTISDNTVFAQLAQDLTLDHVTATAHAMGITSPLTGFPSEALGAVGVSPLEMADAYATIANGGNHVPPTAIEKVVFPDGSVKVLGDPPKKRVFTDGEAYTATQVLKTVIQSGTGTAANIGCPAAGKTGTTSSFTDAYFVGYTPKLTTAVWVGYPNSTISMNDVNGLGPGFGGTLAAPIWHDYMTKAIGGYCSDFTTPNNPFQGTAFFGKFATTGSSASNSSGSGSSGATTTGGAGVTTSTTSTTPTTPKTTSTGGTHTTPLGPGTTGTPTTGGAGAGRGTTTSATGVHGAPPGFGGGHKP
jgi:penicillin-binding protein 1A